MIISKTNLMGVLKIKLKPFIDFRGKYLETYNNALFKRTKKKIEIRKKVKKNIYMSKKKYQS